MPANEIIRKLAYFVYIPEKIFYFLLKTLYIYVIYGIIET